MPSLMAVPHLSHLVSLASSQMSTPTALRGPCGWGDEVGVPAANGATSLVASCWLTLWGPHSQFLAVINTSTSVCVYMCGCGCGWVWVLLPVWVWESPACLCHPHTLMWWLTCSWSCDEVIFVHPEDGPMKALSPWWILFGDIRCHSRRLPLLTVWLTGLL